jgi:hypothetical protein
LSACKMRRMQNGRYGSFVSFWLSPVSSGLAR